MFGVRFGWPNNFPTQRIFKYPSVGISMLDKGAVSDLFYVPWSVLGARVKRINACLLSLKMISLKYSSITRCSQAWLASSKLAAIRRIICKYSPCCQEGVLCETGSLRPFLVHGQLCALQYIFPSDSWAGHAVV